MIGGMESWGSSPADGEREMTDTTTTTIGITTPTYRPITTWYEQMQADWAAESAAYDWDAIDYPVSLDEQVAEAMLMMTIDLERGTQDYLGQVNELNGLIWEQVRPGPGPVSTEYWLMSVEYLGY